MKRADTITYANTLSGDVAVYLGSRRVGTIIILTGRGYAYVPAGRVHREHGDVYATVEATKRSLEREEPDDAGENSF